MSNQKQSWISRLASQVKQLIFHPRKNAVWNISVTIRKNVGVETTSHITLRSNWPAKGNSLIWDAMQNHIVQKQLELYGLYDPKTGEYSQELNRPTTPFPQLVIHGLSNSVGPVGSTQFIGSFVKSNYDAFFVLPDFTEPTDIEEETPNS